MSLEPTTASLSKNSSNNPNPIDEASDEEEIPQLVAQKSVSQQPILQKSDTEGPQTQITDKLIGDIIQDFKDNHINSHISKGELESIVDVVREGVKGIDYNEEKFLKAQFSDDIIRLQYFIDSKLQEIIKATFVENGVNIHNKEEFPSLGDSFEGKKSKNKSKPNESNKKKAKPEKMSANKHANLLEELKADKIAKESETKTDELVTVKLHDPSGHFFTAESDQPLTKWMSYEDNLFVMGNVSWSFTSLSNKRTFLSCTISSQVLCSAG